MNAWDAEAATFDDEPDHGLRDPRIRRAWSALLATVLPKPPAPAKPPATARPNNVTPGTITPGTIAPGTVTPDTVTPAAGVTVADLGCGTGSLSVLLAEDGYDVTGLDSSPRMLDQARAKAERHRVGVAWCLGDAARPEIAGGRDVVLVRHVLWALPDPAAALANWVRLLNPHGRLILIEGRWATGAGIAAHDCTALVRRYREEADVRTLADPDLWGGPMLDERYLLVSRR